jgi:tetraacyldisaccharide 4'-kinase
MGMRLEIKKKYLYFISKDDRGILGKIFYSLLIMLSYIYATAVAIRNSLYDFNIIKSYTPKAKLISVGNLSWAGSGKTPLSIWLYEKLSASAKACIVRRGYGDDENKLLGERVGDVFFAPDRCSLIKRKQRFFDLFILDDGFQYRRLKSTVSIVIMGAREFKGTYRLIPASYFREPFASLWRADIVVVNHSDELTNRKKVKKAISAAAPQVCVYFSSYSVRGFKGVDGKVYKQSDLIGKPMAAFAAIGYPEGFFRKLKKLGFDVRHQISYPDHHRLSVREFLSLEDSLLQEGINYIMITHKDKYHFPYQPKKLKIIVMEIDFSFEDEDGFLIDLKQKLGMD